MPRNLTNAQRDRAARLFDRACAAINRLALAQRADEHLGPSLMAEQRIVHTKTYTIDGCEYQLTLEARRVD